MRSFFNQHIKKSEEFLNFDGTPLSSTDNPGFMEPKPLRGSNRTLPKSQRKLLEEELNSSRMTINNLEEELEMTEKSAAEKVASYQNLVEHYERAVEFRQMHLNTAHEDLDEALVKVNALESRIKSIRSKALQRKFQSRFWMVLFVVSMVEHLFPGILGFIFKEIICPLTIGIVNGTGILPQVIRTGLILMAALYFKVYKVVLNIPSLI